MKLRVITNSELETWRTCQERHHYAYVELLRPAVDALPRSAGGILHEGAEAGWRAAWELPEASLDRRLELAISGATQRIGSATREEVARLESLVAAGEPIDRIEQAIEELREAETANMWALAHYFRCAKPDLAFVPLLIEAEFAYRVPDRIGRPGALLHAGKIDLVLWDLRTNQIGIQDHKGTGAAVSGWESKMRLDTQLTGYVAAVREMQKNGTLLEASLANTAPGARDVVLANVDELARASCGSVALNVIRRERPAEPKVNLLQKKQAVTEEQRRLLALQDETKEPQGEVSVAACDTTAEIYAEALARQLIERGLEPTEKQRAMLQRLRDRGDTFFAQFENWRPDSEVSRWRLELWAESAKIAEVKRTGRRTRNPGACTAPWSSRCPYETICLDPTDPTARNGFVVVDRPHQELTWTGKETADGKKCGRESGGSRGGEGRGSVAGSGDGDRPKLQQLAPGQGAGFSRGESGEGDD